MKTMAAKIPYVNIAGQHATLKVEILAAVERVIERGQFILGEEVSQFEESFARMCGVRFAVGVNSGTDALVLALRVMQIGSGDEVITVPNSFISTAAAIRMAGARPVFVDVREDSNLNPDQLERAITSKTKAILPVHLTGRPADMDPILRIAKAHRLHVIEDCAQAVAAEYKGQRVGSFGTLGCFSLHPLKTLNACGDGGVLTTGDENLYSRLKTLRNIGLRNRDECDVWSGNSRLDTLQAAILLVKMKYFETWTEKRRGNARFYQRELAGIRGLEVPLDRPFEKSVYHTFVIQAEGRDSLKRFLAEKGVETAIHYPIPIHLQTAAKELGYGPGNFPIAESQAQRSLSLPIHPELSESGLEYISKSIQEFFRSHP